MVRAFRAIVGLDFVRFDANGKPVAWRIAGGRWSENPREAAEIVRKYGACEENVPAWALTEDDLK